MKPTLAEKALAYARLLRLSNGPTAVADVWMGYAVASHSLEPAIPLALMTLASLCAYHGGMAMNDAVDAVRDAAEARGRPVESGFVSANVAWVLSIALLMLCLAISCLASVLIGSVASLVVGAALTLAVCAYNSRYKATLAAPLLMGFCRFLNVQLGSCAGEPLRDVPPPLKGSLPPGIEDAWFASVMIGIYVVGLTLFARNEASDNNRSRLVIATAISAASLAVFAYGQWPTNRIEPATWYTIWAIVALIATRGMVAAILQPTPKRIGRGVGIAIQGLVVIDATLAALYAGPMAGLAILALLPVTMLLARWIPQT